MFYYKEGSQSFRMWASILFLLVFGLTSGFSASNANDKSIQAQLEKYMEKMVTDEHFQGSVLVAKEGEILLNGGWGMADLDGGVENTSSTKFLIGSITKSFTAVSILQLRERGLLELSDPIGNYTNQIPAGIADEITIHHLLSHTSGLADYVSIPGFQERAEKPIAPKEIVAFFKDIPLHFVPGSQFEYSSSGYVLLGQVIEKVSGQKYEDYIRKNILKPLGMNSTGIFNDYSDRKDFAVGYETGSDANLIKSRIIHPSAGFSAGALASTVEDLYLFDRALYGTKLLTQESIGMMLTPQTGGYGYGLSIGTIDGHVMIGHGGGTPGFITMFQRWVDDDICVIVLCNYINVSDYEIAVDLAAIALGTPLDAQSARNSKTESASNAGEKIDLPEVLLEKYTGIYRIDPPGFDLKVILRNGVLYAEALGNPAIEMIPVTRKEFSLRGLTAKIVFHIQQDESVNQLQFSQEGLEATGTRIIE